MRTRDMYDAIIVGARCAGSPLATLLARKGHRVLLVDKARFPSDKPLSTHSLLRPGCAVLERLGLLDSVRASNCRPINGLVLDHGATRIAAPWPRCSELNVMYCPRRVVLDNILVQGAVDRGVDFRPGVVVEEFLSDGVQITGIRCRSREGGAVWDEHAQIVIGADGLHSKLADTVTAPKFHEVPTQTGVYFSYWSNIPLETGSIIHFRHNRLLPAVATNDGLTVIMDYFPIAEYERFRGSIEDSFMSDWRRHVPGFFDLMMQGKREERWVGTNYQPNYWRKSYGPGWVLIGDSALHHDSIHPSGITYALVDAEFVAAAIDDGLTGRVPMLDALAAYERARQARWLPHYRFITELSGLKHKPLPPAVTMAGPRPGTNPAHSFLAFFEGHDEGIRWFASKTATPNPAQAGLS